VTIEQVGNTAAFLLSDLAAGVTAEIVQGDSGFSAVVGAMASGTASISARQFARWNKKTASFF